MCEYREAAATTCKLPVSCLLMTMDGIDVPFEDPTVDMSVYTVEATNMFSRKNILSINTNKGELCTTVVSSATNAKDKQQTTAADGSQESLDVVIEL